MTAKEILQRSLEKLNDGKDWTRGVYSDENQRFCAVGAVMFTSSMSYSSKAVEKARQALYQALPKEYKDLYSTDCSIYPLITRFNDTQACFEPVKKLFLDAMELCSE